MFSRIHCVYFSLHTAEEIKTLAVKKVTNPQTYDALLHPTKNGFMDPVFGPNDKDGLCDTCGLGSMNCPGHFGYVELPLPVYHPMFFQLMLKILKGSCSICHRLVATMSKSHLFLRQCQLLEKGLITEATNLNDVYGSANAAAAAASATEMNLQKLVCDELDNYYHDVLKEAETIKRSPYTKNLVQKKLELVKEFLQVLLGKKGDCPHCGSPQKAVRHEHNTRIYYKLSQKKARKISKTKKADKKLQGKESSTSLVQERSLTRRLDEPQDEILDDVENDEEGEEEDDEGGNGATVNNNNGSKEDSRKVLLQEYITPDEVKQHMIQLWNTNGKVMECLLGSYNLPFSKKKVSTPEIFFLDVVAVPPVRFRPHSFAGDKQFENPQTSNLSKILWHAKLVEEILKRIRNGDEDDGLAVTLTSENFQKGRPISVPGDSFKEQLNNAWVALQTHVNIFMDSSLDKLNRTSLPGVRQLLEKKEGLFRKHMMGKRVNYACRSVISPDPYINTDEIGVPMVFASSLTYPQPVTPWNLNQLKQMVINGPDKYPGAVMVEFEDGTKKILSMLEESKRRAIANQLLTSSIASSGAGAKGSVNCGKKVYRHLVNGDVMLLNRQPTLHKPSIMAHKVKVLPKEKTLRLHYANCKSYNADFDGDEMNAHFPQSELGRAEACNLVSTNLNYLSPKDGKPLAGLIQDHVVSGVRMTTRDTLFNRDDYQQLIYNALIDKPGRIKLVPPCIQKPVKLWSGKQIFSSVLLNIIPHDKPALNMAGNRAKVSDDNWPKIKVKKSIYPEDPFLKESQVIIRGGELMTGILDKTQYGATAFSLVHCVYELYGGVMSGKLLSALARLFTAYLQHAGFTLGIEDILVLPPAEEKRREILEEGRRCGDQSALEAVNLKDCDGETLYKRLQEAHYNNQGAELKQLDLAMKSRTDSINNKVNSVCMRGLLKKFPSNSLQLMVQSGAKGSSVNTMQISCLLGQIELEGRRPPLSVSGRSLPSFVPYDTSPRAGGFVDGRFLTGIRPQEYFFHCMAGREGLIDTAVKTSRSGYLQRCLIKHLEALYVQYDMTVRDGDGSVVQFLYGDDSVDVLKCQYLQTNQFKTVVDNYKSYVNILKPSEMSKVVDVKKTRKLQKKHDKWKKNHGNKMYSLNFSHLRKAPFNLYEQERRRRVEKQLPSKERTNCRTQADLKLFKKWYEASETRKASYLDQCQPCPDPTLSRCNPTCYFGSVSEHFRACVEDYITKNPDDMLIDDDEEESDDEEEDEKKLRHRGCGVNKGTFLPMMLIKYMRSLVEPGEAVGLLAAQSVGEPSTQMTLNTFHFAGRGDMNVTLGIPRLREILMTASVDIKTPQMDVLIKPGEEENAKIIAKSFTRFTLLEALQQVSVSESLEKSYLDPRSRCREFTIRFEILPPYTYEDTTVVNSEKIMMFLETEFFVRIITQVKKTVLANEKEKVLKAMTVEESRTNRASIEDRDGEAPDDEPDDLADLSDDDVGEDGGADDEKGRRRRIQFTSYDNPEAKQKEIDEDMFDSSDLKDDVERERGDEAGEEEGVFNTSTNEGSQPQYGEGIKPKTEPVEFPENPRIMNVLRRDPRITGYLVDEENQWCEVTMQFTLFDSKVMMVGLIERLAAKAVIHSAPGINRAMVTGSKDPNEMGRSRLKTEGVNIQQLWKYPEMLNLETLYSNNIHKIAKTYGIEAARSVLIKEVQDVFKVYGIHINPRHLSLIADYMTYEGAYKPFSRVGIQSNPFPFQKMSFETSMNFLRSATAFGQPDELGSPSSRIIVGRVINQGTGMMDLLPKLTV